MRQVNQNFKEMAPFEDDDQIPVLSDNWTESCPSCEEPGHTVDEIQEEVDSMPSKNHAKIKKKVSFRLSDIKRNSLTGSLPDLAKASDKGTDKNTENVQTEVNIKRGPLPEGSDIFRAVMEEIDSEADDTGSDENIADSFNRSWSSSSGKNASVKQQFQSKTAAAIYAKLFVSPYPKSAEKNAPSSPKQRPSEHGVPKHTSPRPSPKVITENVSNASSSASARISAKMSLKSASPPSSNVSNKNNPPALKLSPLVSGEIGDVRISSEKVGIRRQLSMPGESPRLLQRSKDHRKLSKSASFDR